MEKEYKSHEEYYNDLPNNTKEIIKEVLRIEERALKYRKSSIDREQEILKLMKGAIQSDT